MMSLVTWLVSWLRWLRLGVVDIACILVEIVIGIPHVQQHLGTFRDF